MPSRGFEPIECSLVTSDHFSGPGRRVGPVCVCVCLPVCPACELNIWRSSSSRCYLGQIVKVTRMSKVTG